jgi:hypothetical protein
MPAPEPNRLDRISTLEALNAPAISGKKMISAKPTKINAEANSNSESA